MAALPYIQIYPADYLADTPHLTTEEHGAYLLLILNYWQTGKAIPAKRLAGVSKMNERWSDVEQTLNEFFTIDENGAWYHERIEEDLIRVLDKATKASKAGKKSAQKRALKSKPSNSRSTSVQQSFNQTETETETETDNTTVRKNKARPKDVEEVREYILLKKYAIDAQYFIDYHIARGWKLKSGHTVKDWKAVVRTWGKRAGTVKDIPEEKQLSLEEEIAAHDAKINAEKEGK